MSQGPDRSAERVGELLDAAERTLAVAESLTGGELSARFARAPGASEWFRGGLVAYSSAVKQSVLGVPPGPVVSEPAVTAMAEGIVEVLGADVGLAATGAAGPASQDGQPPGTVWLAIHDGHRTLTRLEHFPGDPEAVVDHALRCAVEWLDSHLRDVAD